MDKPKRPSGGKRATERRRKLREQMERQQAATGGQPLTSPWPDPPADARQAADWILLRLLDLAVEARIAPDLTAAQQRHEAATHLARAAKSVDAAKLRVEMDELTALVNDRGAQVDGGEDRGAEETPRH